MFFFKDIADVVGSFVGEYTAYNLIGPIYIEAIQDGVNGKPWQQERINATLRDRIAAFYDCNVEKVAKIATNIIIALSSKHHSYLKEVRKQIAIKKKKEEEEEAKKK